VSLIEERLNQVMLKVIRRKVPGAGIADLDRSIYDLDLDSLEVVDLTQAVEEEFGVEADLNQVSSFMMIRDIKVYFEGLIGAP
jgi:acyl carrier protein